MKAVGNVGNDLEMMAQLLPNEIQKINEQGDVQTISNNEIQVDDFLVVKAGESRKVERKISNSTKPIIFKLFLTLGSKLQ
ncbi:hypothetical protein ACF3NG_07665 [Aerococcaceae bacterium WGS1372]